MSAAVAALVIVVSLVGCTPRDRVMTSIQDGQLVFVPCVEITGVQWIRASLRGEVYERWESRGEDGVFGPGHPLTFGVTPEGFSDTVEPDPFDWAGETIYFSVANTAVTRRLWIVDGDTLVEGKWLDQDGRLHDQPCA